MLIKKHTAMRMRNRCRYRYSSTQAFPSFHSGIQSDPRRAGDPPIHTTHLHSLGTFNNKPKDDVHHQQLPKKKSMCLQYSQKQTSKGRTCSGTLSYVPRHYLTQVRTYSSSAVVGQPNRRPSGENSERRLVGSSVGWLVG